MKFKPEVRFIIELTKKEMIWFKKLMCVPVKHCGLSDESQEDSEMRESFKKELDSLKIGDGK